MPANYNHDAHRATVGYDLDLGGHEFEVVDGGSLVGALSIDLMGVVDYFPWVLDLPRLKRGRVDHYVYLFQVDDPSGQWPEWIGDHCFVGGGILNGTDRECSCREVNDGEPLPDCDRCEGDGVVDSPGGAWAVYERVEEPDWSWVTDSDFDNALEDLLDTMLSAQILAIPGVYEVISEHLNNEVLETVADCNGRDPQTGHLPWPTTSDET